MKKLIRCICIILVCGLLFAVPAQAAETVEPRASYFFSCYGTDLYKTSSTSFQIWFDVVSNVLTMDVLGVSEIILYQSADQQSWTKIQTYYMEDYPQMVAQNTCSHDGYVPYNSAIPGYYYRAYITFYARSGNGTGERYVYTEILRM